MLQINIRLKMKKLFFASALILTGLGITACSSDDDSSGGSVVTNPMIGEWEAVELSYIMPGSDTSHTFPFTAITAGCDVDEIVLTSNFASKLDVETKEEGVCIEKTYVGSWDNEKITFDGMNTKYVVSSSETELVLRYEMTYSTYGDLEVTVKYTKS